MIPLSRYLLITFTLLVGVLPVLADENWSGDWQSTMETAKADGRRPVLVKYEASWCGPCRLQTAAMKEPDVMEVLKDFHLILVDVDSPPEGVDVTSVVAMPTLRVLTPDGDKLDEHVGMMEGEQLKTWLRESLSGFEDDLISKRMLDDLVGDDLNETKIEFLIGLLDDSSPQRRSAAAGLLIQFPSRVAGQIVDTAVRGETLRERSAAWSILRRWPAPLQGMDPWVPESLTEDRINGLESWASDVADNTSAEPPADVSERAQVALAEGELELDRLVRRGPMRLGLIDSIALVGPAILPSVTQRLDAEASDAGRERLSAVRYRLIASPSLALRTPGAAEALASLESGPRRAATKRIAENAGNADLPLLQTLFGHEDPLVRELALRGIQSAGGESLSLVDLLDDPDKNVRVAVLKMWLDDPDASLLGPVSKRALSEQDPGLLPYYLRLIKAIGIAGPEASKVLEKFAEHEDWQVRAEVAGVIAEYVKKDKSNRSEDLPKEYQTIARKLLKDSDSFVLSQIVPPVLARDQLVNFDRLVEIAWKYPEIRSIILPSLHTLTVSQTTKTMLSERFASDVEDDRVFALRAATDFGLDEIQTWIEKGLRDDSQAVRIAATKGLSRWLDDYHASLPVLPTPAEDNDQFTFSSPVFSESVKTTPSSETKGFFSAIGELFGSSAIETFPAEVATMDEPTPTDAESADAELADTEPAKSALAELVESEFVPAVDTNSEAEPVIASEAEIQAYDEMVADAFDGAASKPAPDTAKMIQDAKKYDEWLANWRKDPASEVEWLRGVPEIVDELTRLDDPEASSQALLVSIRLGADVPIESIREAMHHLDEADDRITALYPWSMPESRRQFFDLLADANDADDLLTELHELASLYDPTEAADLFWRALNAFRIDTFESGWSIRRTLMKITTGEEYFYSGQGKDYGPIADALAARVAETSEPVARLVGLSVLGQLEPEAALEFVGESYADKSLDIRLRRDWARFSLSLRSQDEFLAQAVAFLQDDELLPVALTAITSDREGISATEIGHIQVPSGNRVHSSSGRLQVPKLPPGISVGTFRPLLKHEDEEVVAQATYVLSLLGEDLSLDTLIDAAKEELFSFHEPMTMLLIQAIADRDDDTMVELLENVYETLDIDNEYYAKRLYWKIRIMTGPNALRLRARMRSDHGMEQLI